VEGTAAQNNSGAFVCRAVVSDIAERKLKEAEKAELEAQNRQLELSQSKLNFLPSKGWKAWER